MLSSVVLAPYSIPAALVEAEQILGKNRNWLTTNEKQNWLLEIIFAACRGDIIRIPEVTSVSSYSWTEINDLLSKNGFNIQLEPFSPPDFGVASILKLVLEWLKKGEYTPLDSIFSNGTFPGVRMQRAGIEFYASPYFKHPIVAIKTTTTDTVYLTMLDQPVAEEDLLSLSHALLETKQPSGEDFLGVEFPMVDLDIQADLSWLCGMNTAGEDGAPAIISQAKQQTKLKMDELGAAVESAVALGVKRFVGGPAYHTICQPFLMVVHRPCLAFPIFMGYLAEDCWKRPTR